MRSLLCKPGWPRLTKICLSPPTVLGLKKVVGHHAQQAAFLLMKILQMKKMLSSVCKHFSSYLTTVILHECCSNIDMMASSGILSCFFKYHSSRFDTFCSPCKFHILDIYLREKNYLYSTHQAEYGPHSIQYQSTELYANVSSVRNYRVRIMLLFHRHQGYMLIFIET